MTRRAGGALAALLLAACGTTSPLSREVEIGTDAYAVFTAEGRGTGSDLYALPGRGGRVIQLTYSPVDEMAPALSRDGALLAFVRSMPSGARTVWVQNLISGAEREIPQPDSAAPAERVGWSADGSALYVRGGDGSVWRAAAPPAAPDPRPVPSTGAARAAADSALAVLLGSPAFAAVERCPDGGGLCIAGPGGTAPLAPRAESAARWGADSVAWLEGDELRVRPLGPGRIRPVPAQAMPASPRGLTAFGGLSRAPGPR